MRSVREPGRTPGDREVRTAGPSEVVYSGAAGRRDYGAAILQVIDDGLAPGQEKREGNAAQDKEQHEAALCDALDPLFHGDGPAFNDVDAGPYHGCSGACLVRARFTRRRALFHPDVHQLDRDDRGVALGEHSGEGAVLPHAVPGDEEVPQGIGGDGRSILRARRIGVDPELGAQRRAVARIALPEYSRRAAVTAGWSNQEEGAARVGGHGAPSEGRWGVFTRNPARGDLSSRSAGRTTPALVPSARRYPTHDDVSRGVGANGPTGSHAGR